MRITFEMTDDILIAKLDGELDHHSASSARSEIDKTLDALQCKSLVMDFKQVSFMDSSGIGVVMGRYNKIKERGGRVLLAQCADYVDRILNMAGIYTIAPKYDTVKAAVKELKGKEEKAQMRGVQ